MKPPENPKTIRAKVKCVSIERKEHHNRVADKEGDKLLHFIRLHPVFSAIPGENRTYFEAIPYGEVKLGTLIDEIAAEFEVGAEYYLTLERAVSDGRQTPTRRARSSRTGSGS